MKLTLDETGKLLPRLYLKVTDNALRISFSSVVCKLNTD